MIIYIIIISIISLIFIVIYSFFINGSWPKQSVFKLDFSKIRDLGQSDKAELPEKINFIVIAKGKLPRCAVIAGKFGKKIPIEFPSFQIVYGTKTIIIEIPFNKRLFSKFPYGTEFNDENYNIMQNALKNADIIIPTHEHWDHLGGIAQSENLKEILPKTIITKNQFEGPTIIDAEFPDKAFDDYKPLEYKNYHRIAPGMVLIAAPGHSVGHQLIYVLLQNGEEFLFSGDIVWVMNNIKQKKARPLIVNIKRRENRKQISHQMRWIYDEFITKENSIKILPTHDPDLHSHYCQQGWLNRGFQ